jgi:hypothetical protein
VPGFTSYFYVLGHVDVLPDLGFHVVPQAVAGSLLAKVSGLMATMSGYVCTFLHLSYGPASPVCMCRLICILRQILTGETHLCTKWFRCMAIMYVLRMLTLGWTSLPGPALHCRGEYLLRPVKCVAL